MNSILLGPAQNEFKGNRSMGKPGKVNLAILYRNKFNSEKQTVIQELYSLKLPRDQVWKLMKYKFKKYWE